MILKADCSNWKSIQFNRFYRAELIMQIPHEDSDLAGLMNEPITEHRAIVDVNCTLNFGVGEYAINYGNNLFPFTTWNN